MNNWEQNYKSSFNVIPLSPICYLVQIVKCLIPPLYIIWYIILYVALFLCIYLENHPAGTSVISS